jgi:serine/threonine protein kinase
LNVEYGLGGRVTTKGDVYSYGIVLLEMLTGKKPTNNMFVEGMDLQKWVGSAFPNRVGEVVDIILLRSTSTSIEEDNNLNCLRQLINVGFLCTKESPEGRPSMMDIVGTLQIIRETFLGVVGIPKLQSDITHLLGNSSTTRNNTVEAHSSSSF